MTLIIIKYNIFYSVWIEMARSSVSCDNVILYERNNLHMRKKIMDMFAGTTKRMLLMAAATNIENIAL